MECIIDINADLGEGFPFDSQIMPLISSCSIASGGHFGDENSMRKTIQLAKKYGVKVGAHPSFPDTENFGRTMMEIDEDALLQSLIEQMQIFCKICDRERVNVNHVKPHGALYNLASVDKKISELILQSVLTVSPNSMIYLPGNSLFFALAKEKVKTKGEAFIDRRYTDEGFLVSRSHPDALIEKPEECFGQLIEIVTTKKVTTLSGKKIDLHAETFCIHGDHSNSLTILNYLHQHLPHFNITIA